MEKKNIAMQIKEMVNFIMYVLVEFVFSNSYMYFDLNSNPEICIFYVALISVLTGGS
jgi:hypothetical protein